VLIRKAHLYRLYPTPEQAAVLGQWVGAVRCVYNLALEQRRIWYRAGRRFNFASQCREVTTLRAEFDWLRDVPVHPLQQAVKDLDQAYQNWWAGRTKAPTPRKRGLNDAMRFPDSATFAFRRISRRLDKVKLPKLGWVRLRWDRAIPGEVKNITVSRQAGIWQLAALYEREVAEAAPSHLPGVGIDRGVNVFAALSDGSMIEPANCGKKALAAVARAQRKLARKKRGSNNRRKQARRVAGLHKRVANARKDFLHKASTSIAQSHGVVVLEKLKVRNMVRSAAGSMEAPGKRVRTKSGLNRAILDQGWGAFRVMLGWKLAERGGRLVEVPAENSSRICAACGVVDAASRSGQQFRCVACGHEAHADTNAAIEILRRWGTSSLPVEASRRRAVEAGTCRRAV
jgi:putative transposase